MTEAYADLRRDLEQRAQTLMSQPHATINEVIAVLDSNHNVPASALNCTFLLDQTND